MEMLPAAGRSQVRSAARLAIAVAAAHGMLSFGPARPARADDPRVVTTHADRHIAEGQRSKSKLYLTARQAATYVAAHDDIILIDVRDPESVAREGLARPTARNIPIYFRKVLRPGKVDEMEQFEPNRDFVPAVRRLLAERGAGPDATLFLICWRGSFSSRAATLLAEAGHNNVYTIIDGHYGDVRNGVSWHPGWRRRGLPWLERPLASQLYRPAPR